MKRYLIYYGNSHMEQSDILNPQFDHLIKIRVINFIIDTVQEICWGIKADGSFAKVPIPTPDPVNLPSLNPAPSPERVLPNEPGASAE